MVIVGFIERIPSGEAERVDRYDFPVDEGVIGRHLLGLLDTRSRGLWLPDILQRGLGALNKLIHVLSGHGFRG
jgi:hypothetical protein